MTVLDFSHDDCAMALLVMDVKLVFIGDVYLLWVLKHGTKWGCVRIEPQYGKA